MSPNYKVDEGYSLNLNAGASFDVDAPFGDTLTYAWDLNNDGDYLDSGEAAGTSPTRTISDSAGRLGNHRSVDSFDRTEGHRQSQQAKTAQRLSVRRCGR
ncbi:MAG: hypothetical protein U0936_06730 [Planctomycetaceae bacterium]